MSSIKLRVAVALSGLALACAAQAQQAAAPKKGASKSASAVAAEFDKFRDLMAEASPAELFEAKGEELWKTKRGPKNASLEKCDLGLGPGVLKGAYVRMPRYFADADQVMDAERRIVHCMVTLQGFKAEDLAKKPFSKGKYTPDPVSLVTYVAAQSRGMKVAERSRAVWVLAVPRYPKVRPELDVDPDFYGWHRTAGNHPGSDPTHVPAKP